MRPVATVAVGRFRQQSIRRTRTEKNRSSLALVYLFVTDTREPLRLQLSAKSFLVPVCG
jgi:hypothetical protein